MGGDTLPAQNTLGLGTKRSTNNWLRPNTTHSPGWTATTMGASCTKTKRWGHATSPLHHDDNHQGRGRSFEGERPGRSPRPTTMWDNRSEERRVGKECRCGEWT